MISAAESDNYKAASATVVISVSPLKVYLPIYTETEFAYSGTEIVFIEDDIFYTVTDGSATEIGSYVATVELKDTVNLAWADESFTGSIFWSIV